MHILQIFQNFGALIALYVILTVTGLGVALWACPGRAVREVFFCAPICGFILITSFAVFWFDVLQRPACGGRMILGLLIGNGLAVWACSRQFRIAWYGFFKLKSSLRLLWVPVISLLLAAVTFQKQGFNLLQGGQDELNYCAISRQMATHLNTGDTLDMFIPRQTNFIHDSTVRDMAYTTAHRHGSEAYLAMMTQFFGGTPEEVFPVHMEVQLAVLLLTVGWLLWRVFRLPLPAAVAAQFAMGGLHELVLLHAQGALANINTIGLRLLVPVLFAGLVLGVASNWRLLGICTGGIILVYPEAFFPGCLFPCAVTLVCQRFWALSLKIWIALGAAMLLAMVVANISLVPAFGHTVGNTALGLGQTRELLQHPFSSGVWVPAITMWANHGFAHLGVATYYSGSSWNSHIARWWAARPWVSAALWIVSGGFAMVTLFRKRLTLPLGVALGVWMVLTALFLVTADFLRFVRSFEYALPMLIIGCVMGVSELFLKRQIRKSFHWITFGWSLFVLSTVTLLIFMNWRSSLDARFRLAQDAVETTTTINRFDPALPFFQQMVADVQRERGDAPVLITGWKQTVMPFLLACLLDDVPSVAGNDMLKFWAVYPQTDIEWDKNDPITKQNYQALINDRFRFRHDIKRNYDMYVRETSSWKTNVQKMISSSRVAIVSPHGDFPDDWKDDSDIFPVLRWHFGRYGDILCRYNKVIELVGKGAGAKCSDDQGTYRQYFGECFVIGGEPLPAGAKFLFQFDAPIRIKESDGWKIVVDANDPSMKSMIFEYLGTKDGMKQHGSVTFAEPAKLRKVVAIQ